MNKISSADDWWLDAMLLPSEAQAAEAARIAAKMMELHNEFCPDTNSEKHP